MNTTKTQYREGDRVYCAARDGARMARVATWSVPIYTGGIYEARIRQRDGTLTWRRVGSFGGTRAGLLSDRFENYLRDNSPGEWLDVRHGQACND